MKMSTRVVSVCVLSVVVALIIGAFIIALLPSNAHGQGIVPVKMTEVVVAGGEMGPIALEAEVSGMLGIPIHFIRYMEGVDELHMMFAFGRQTLFETFEGYLDDARIGYRLRRTKAGYPIYRLTDFDGYDAGRIDIQQVADRVEHMTLVPVTTMQSDEGVMFIPNTDALVNMMMDNLREVSGGQVDRVMLSGILLR